MQEQTQQKPVCPRSKGSVVKRVLFWVLFIPMVIIMILSDTLAAFAEWYDGICHRFEAWCFDYPFGRPK